MNSPARLVSKVLVLDSNDECGVRINAFCDDNKLVGLKVQGENIVPALKSNVDLGGILLSESYLGKACGGIVLARTIRAIRPELPIFLRLEKTDRIEDLSERDRKLFSAAYKIDDIDNLCNAINASLFSQIYPNALVRGIAELTKIALESQFKDMIAEVETPYLVRDRIIFGEIFTLMPLESNWCRGYMMLQAEEEPLLHIVKADRMKINIENPNDFRNLNNLLGESANLIWGAFKNRYISQTDINAHLAQVPIVVNHLHRYISFGSEDPQLCFKYTLTDKSKRDSRSLTLLQRFVFNLNWSPDNFKESQVSTEGSFESGELELF